MKQIVIVLCWLLPLFAIAQEKPAINFSKAQNWSELLRESKEADKPILIDAFTTWCGPCKKMDKEVFSNPEVAEYINTHFIVLKVQMDSTKKDGEIVRVWRKEADAYFTPYVTAYPCYLFFQPDGKYNGRELGFHQPYDFIDILKNAVDPRGSYLTQLDIFRKGELSKKDLLNLAYRANEYKDTAANTIAKSYKSLYIDKQPLDSILNPNGENFIAKFYKIFLSSDPVIQYMHDKPDLADTRFKRDDGFSERVSDAVILQDYMERYLPDDKNHITDKDWERLQKNMAKKYDKQTAEQNTLSGKFSLAIENKRFEEASKWAVERAEKYGFDTTGIGRAMFNNLLYTIVFKNSTDLQVLKRAAKLMRKVNELEKNQNPGNLDTYAALLYKAGQKEKAIEIEKEVIEIARKGQTDKDDNNVKLFTDLLRRMENGEEIWKDNEL